MSETMRIRIGNQSSFSSKPIIRPFEYAAAQGFDAFEWFPDKKESGEGWTEEDMTKETRSLIRETARAKDIALSVHMSNLTDPLKPWACGLFTKDIGFARDIGAVLFNRTELMRMRFEIADEATERFDDLMAAIDVQIDALAQE